MNELELLEKLYEKLVTTKEVAEEYRKTLPDWIKIQHVKNKNYQTELELVIDKGEASAIALAVEIGDCIILLMILKLEILQKKSD